MDVLCLDDDRDFTFILEKILKKKKYRPRFSFDPDDFYREFNHVHPDLCIIDLYVGDSLEGLKVIKKLKSLTGASNTQILAISRIDEQDCIDKAIELGANDFLCKPIDEFALSKKIELLYQKKITEENKLAIVPPEFNKGVFRGELRLEQISCVQAQFVSPAHISSGTEILVENHFSDSSINSVLKFQITRVEKRNDEYILYVNLNDSNRALYHQLKNIRFNQAFDILNR